MSDETLQDIRNAELDAARRLEAARTAAEAAVTDARRRAQRLVEQAREEGRAEADRRYRQTVDAARGQAGSIDAEDRIAKLTARVEPKIPALVDAIVELVLSPPAGQEP